LRPGQTFQYNKRRSKLKIGHHVERVLDTSAEETGGAYRCVQCGRTWSAQVCPEGGVPCIPAFEWKEDDPVQGKALGGQYLALMELGSGAAARVFSAWDKVENRPVALKVIREPGDKEQAERFRREAIATKRFEHPNIVKMEGAGHDVKTGLLFLVLEQLEGRPLDRLIAAEAPVNPDEAFRLAIPICEALSAIHEGGLIHRDVKPANLFVARDERGGETVKILDFGITRFAGDDPVDQALTAGRVLGSVIYASPEQALRAPLDARSDLYALGIILYELLMGLPPFDRDTPLETLKAHVEERSPLLPLEFPRDVSDLVESLLEKDPGRRPQSALQVLAALDRILGRLKRSEGISVPVRAAEGIPVGGEDIKNPWQGPDKTPNQQPVESPQEAQDSSSLPWVIGSVVLLGVLWFVGQSMGWV